MEIFICLQFNFHLYFNNYQHQFEGSLLLTTIFYKIRSFLVSTFPRDYDQKFYHFTGWK